MTTPAATADTFRQLDFHDDTLVSVRLLPSQRRREGEASVVEIQLQRCPENGLRVIEFAGCTNVRVAVDFDVLADNLPPNTSRVDADTDLSRMRNLMESQQCDWDVGYGRQASSPLTKKLAALRELVFFRVQFFGGVVDVIARGYQVQTANKHMQPTPR